MSHLRPPREPISGSAMSWTGPCDRPGCKRTSADCARFREALKPELKGKQVCTTRSCQIWGGNRDEEKEKASKEQAKEQKQREREAAQALAGVAAAGVAVSPRRHGQAVPLPANAAPQPTQQAVPVAGGSWFGGWFANRPPPVQQQPPSTQQQSRSQTLVCPYDIIGTSQFDPSRPDLINPKARRDWRTAGYSYDGQLIPDLGDPPGETFVWVRGRFKFADASTRDGADASTEDGFDGVGWVTESELAESMRNTDEEFDALLLNCMLSYSTVVLRVVERARTIGSAGHRDCAPVASVRAALRQASDCALDAHDTELDRQNDRDNGMPEDERCSKAAERKMLAAAEAMTAFAVALASPGLGSNRVDAAWLSVRMGPADAGKRRFVVRMPAGAKAGEEMIIDVEGVGEYTIQLPEGAEEGDSILVDMPSQPTGVADREMGTGRVARGGACGAQQQADVSSPSEADDDAVPADSNGSRSGAAGGGGAAHSNARGSTAVPARGGAARGVAARGGRGGARSGHGRAHGAGAASDGEASSRASRKRPIAAAQPQNSDQGLFGSDEDGGW